MHVILRDSSSRLFYAGPAKWTSDSEYARDFGSISKAEQFGRSQKIPALQIVLRYDAPVCELILPMPEATSPRFAYGWFNSARSNSTALWVVENLPCNSFRRVYDFGCQMLDC
jgi:hypothetical protein